MAKRKQGLSMEEKCDRVEAYLAESRQPYTLKELEAALPKAKGVIYQSVQECLETLVSENRAASEKVGISVLFWNFNDGTEDTAAAVGGTGGGSAIPKGIDGKKARVELLSTKKQTLKNQLSDLDRAIAAATDSPEQAARRAELTRDVADLRSNKHALAQELQERTKALNISPARLKKQFQLLTQLVNAWTDNVMLLEDKALQVQGGSRSEFRKHFGIEADFDYV